jgi:sigma54-dependent transcription regulator
MHLAKVEIARLRANRKDSAEKALIARSRAQTSIADGFDRLTAEFDILLARNGVRLDG